MAKRYKARTALAYVPEDGESKRDRRTVPAGSEFDAGDLVGVDDKTLEYWVSSGVVEDTEADKDEEADLAENQNAFLRAQEQTKKDLQPDENQHPAAEEPKGQLDAGATRVADVPDQTAKAAAVQTNVVKNDDSGDTGAKAQSSPTKTSPTAGTGKKG